MLRNFRFIIKGQLAGMAHPGYRATLPAALRDLREKGVGAIVSLDEEGLPDDVVAEHGFAYRHYPVDDFCAPSLAQAEAFVKFVDEELAKGHAVVAHCWAGVGRTGTLLACYLIHRGLPARDAEKRIRRVGGIESAEQENFLRDFERVCRDKDRGSRPLPEEEGDATDPDEDAFEDFT